MRSLSIAAFVLSLVACGSRGDVPDAPTASTPEGTSAPISLNDSGNALATGWNLQSSSEGTALVLFSGGDRPAIRLLCIAGQSQLLVNVPGFRPIASEERLSFGAGGNAVALVADTGGDGQRGGVSGTGAVPDDLAALVGGPVSASYGAQTSGPHPAPRENLGRAFLAACGSGSAAPARPGVSPSAAAGACMMQGSERLQVATLRAIGTEPFWGARIEGRCVTYSHPEDIAGTRVWTHYTPLPGGGTWSGALGGKRFELRTRAEPGCSDGMSDNVYPIAVDLTVNGERRTGCAEPL